VMQKKMTGIRNFSGCLFFEQQRKQDKICEAVLFC